MGGAPIPSGRRFEGKVALVTGAGRGIGRAIALRLADEGASLAVLDISAEGADATTAAIISAGGAAKAFGADVTQRPQVSAAVAAAHAHFGRLDVLVNNAAVGKPVPFLEATDQDWQRILSVNLDGYFIVAQEVARIMASQGEGRIVNVGSLAAHTANDRQSVYAAAKGAVTALSRVMAFELAPKGIAVNVLAPGPIDTELALKMLTPASRRAREERIPMGRIGRPDEVAAAVAFLASADASYINGTVLVLDGGLLTAGIRE